MITLSIGDQARAFATRSGVSRLKNKMNILFKEQGSGQVAELGKRLRGDFREISNIDASLKLHERFDENAKILRQRLAEQQRRMEPVQTESSKLSDTLTTLDSVVLNSNLNIYTEKANSVFRQAVARLNARFLGQSLFSGAMIDKAPLLSADEILDGLKTEIESATSREDALQKISDWFDSNKALAEAFKSQVEDGPEKLLREIPVSENKSVKLTTTAADSVILQTLKGLAITAITAEGYYDGSHGDKEYLLREGARIVYDNSSGLIGAIAKIGHNEGLVKIAEAENSSTITVLKLASNKIRVAEYEDTAAAIQEAKTHLELLHKVTAHVSRLSLAEYLR